VSVRGVPAPHPTEQEMDARLRKISAAVNAGATHAQIASSLHLGTATVTRYVRLGRETGLIRPDRGRRGMRGKW